MAVYNFCGAGLQRLLWRHHHLAQRVRLCRAGRRCHRHRHRRFDDLEQRPYPLEADASLKHYAGALCAAFATGGDVTGGNSQFYFVTALPDSVSSSDRQAELAQNGTDSQVAAYAAVGGLPYLDNTDTVFGQVYQGMDVVDAMACVDTVKDDDGNDTYRPTEEAAITINSVTITTYPGPAWPGADITTSRPAAFSICDGQVVAICKASPYSCQRR